MELAAPAGAPARSLLPVEDDLLVPADWLAAQRLLAESDADDRDKVRAALEFAIAALTGQDDRALISGRPEINGGDDQVP
jgi:hypothetical protein